MKKSILLLLVAVLSFQENLSAAMYTIIVSDYAFSPSSLNLQLGDTIKWVWSSGTHTTTSTTIPAGATSWDASINSSTTTFLYVPSVTGAYNYQCNFHVSMGMKGSFTVSPLSVSQLSNSESMNIYPNPASSMLHLEMPQDNIPCTISIIGLSGKTVFNKYYYNAKNVMIDISSFADGFYFLYIADNKNFSVQKFLKAH